MSRPQQISDEDIIIEARKCFLKYGPGVSTTVIAKNLGVSQPALFKRFKSKKQLMMTALLPPPIPPWATGLEAGPDDRAFAVQLEELAHNATRFFDEFLPRVSTLRSSGIFNDDPLKEFDPPPPVAAMRGISRWLKRCHKKGMIDKANFNAVAMALIGSFMSSSFITYVSAGKYKIVSRKNYIKQFVEIYSSSLAPQGGTKDA